MSKSQDEDMAIVFKNNKIKALDFVGCWYKKSSDYVENTKIRCAFVSTNSICQGEQVGMLWKDIFSKVEIDFAYRTFRWDSEANIKAHVHCIIVGFSCHVLGKNKFIIESGRRIDVKNINAYLIDADNVIIERRNMPICNVSNITLGNVPKDDGNFFLTSEEKNHFIEENPISGKWIKRFYGSREYINNIDKWCLWTHNANPSDLRKSPLVLQRIEAIRNFRLNSDAAATRKMADYPTDFWYISQPDTDYILIPRYSSQRRRYVPIGFIYQPLLQNIQICDIM